MVRFDLDWVQFKIHQPVDYVENIIYLEWTRAAWLNTFAAEHGILAISPV